jgi:hypothetical protein
MKRSLIIAVLVIVLAACSKIVAAPENSQECFDDKERGRKLCVTVRAGNEFVETGGSLPLTITVTSEQDESGLIVVVSTVGYADFMEKIQFPEQNITYRDQFVIGWEFDIKAGQALTFRGAASFTGEPGVFPIKVRIAPPGGGQLASSSLSVYFTEQGGRVYLSGTRIPVTKQPLIETIYIYTYTPGPSPTWAPSATWYPHIETRVALTQQAEPKTPPTEGTLMVTMVVPTMSP